VANKRVQYCLLTTNNSTWNFQLLW